MPSHDAPSADERVAADEVDVWLAGRRRSWIVGNLAVVSFVVGVAGIVAAVALKVRYDVALSSRTGELQVLQSRIEHLKTEQAALHANLEALHRSIDESRDELMMARRQAQVAQCRAVDAQLDAEVTVEQVRCYQQYAEHARCDADNQKEKADGTIFGVLIGVGVAMATGGGSLLVAGGAVVGSAGSGNDECPVVQCDLDPVVIESVVLARHRLSQRVPCEAASRR
jgi:hypothetical protein